MSGAVKSEELLALYSPEQQEALKKVQTALLANPAALDTHNRKQEKANGKD